MRVVMVLGRSTGGIGTHVADLAAGLVGLGDDVQVVTESLTAQRFALPGVRLWFPGRAAGVWGSLRGILRLRRLASTADVVHAHGHQAGLVAVVASWGLSTPVVVSQHNAVLSHHGLRSRVSDAVQRAVARRAVLVTGASSDLVATARALGARHTEVAEVPSPRVPGLLRLPVREASARADLARERLGENGVRACGPLVVTISRIAPQKSLETLVEAAGRLGDAVTWVVIGSGEPVLLASLREQAHRLGAAVHFVGEVADPTDWLLAAEVFVLVSQWEARALVVQEAMAAGVPVVATDTGGLHDLVEDAGVLVPVGDASAVAAAVERVVGSRALHDSLSHRGRQVATSWDDSNATARRWHEWYAALLPMT